MAGKEPGAFGSPSEELNTVQPALSDGTVQYMSCSPGTGAFSRALETKAKDHSQIFAGLNGTLIWVLATKLQTWSRSPHVMSLPGLFSFSARVAFSENCSLSTTSVSKAPEGQMASSGHLSCNV